MKNLFKSYIAICLILFILLYSGCVSTQEPYTSIAIIGGKHANLVSYNIPEIVFENENEYDTNNSLFLSEKDQINKIFGIVVDGNPTEYYSDEAASFFKDFEEAVKNKRWKTVQSDVIDFVNGFSGRHANDEEIDTLEAFHVAANSFDLLGKDIKKRIIVYDSGLTTTGALNFIENEYYKSLLFKDSDLTDEEIQLIVDELDSKKEIPDLSNAKIRWYGIGMVGEKQPELSKMNISNLTAIWKGILKKANVDDIEFLGVNKSENDQEVIDLPNVSVVLFNSSESLGEEELGFEPDKATFLEGTEDKREGVLRKFVQEGMYNTILLVGTTSSGGGNGDGLSLSIDRANAVKTELIKLGVPESKIETMGLGTKHHKYNANEFVNGKYQGDSKAAQENRSVYIMLSSSKEAEYFRNDYEKLNKN